MLISYPEDERVVAEAQQESIMYVVSEGDLMASLA
jgi:hypothetical protein